MQIICKPASQNSKAYALLITLTFVAASLLVFGSMMLRISGSTKVAGRSNQFLASQAAAEAATETILTRMDRDFLYGSLTNASAYSALLPSTNGWPIPYLFSRSVTIGPDDYTTNYVPLTSIYTGLSGIAQDATITATATPIGQNYNVPATVSQYIQFASIPVFQFAIFYNLNLEIDPGAPMSINGGVFSNQGIWAGTPNITFNSIVEAVNKVYYADNNSSGDDPWASGKSESSNTPKSNFTLAGQPAFPVNALTLPIAGTNANNPAVVESILQLPPSDYALGTSAAYSTNGQIYLANEADLIISNSASGINGSSLATNDLTVFYQDSSNPNHLKVVSPDVPTIVTNITTNGFTTGFVTNITSTTTGHWPNKTTTYTTNITQVTIPTLSYSYTTNYYYYSFVSNTNFYDYREDKIVQAVQINVTNLSIWMNSTNLDGGSNIDDSYNQQNSFDKGHPIDSIYVYNSVPLTSSQLPAVLVFNGTQLPTAYGLTVATPMPLYVWGNYNVTDGSGVSDAGENVTADTWPAAFMADAITVLSAKWYPGYPGGAGKNPTPSVTTINAACLEGIVESTNSNYSGGVENFLRLQENWGGQPLWYNGSIVVMFPSQYATNYWSYGSYYTAPARNWAFDTNFRMQSKLPPLTPQIKAVIRNQWNAQ